MVIDPTMQKKRASSKKLISRFSIVNPLDQFDIKISKGIISDDDGEKTERLFKSIFDHTN